MVSDENDEERNSVRVLVLFATPDPPSIAFPSIPLLHEAISRSPRD